MVALLLDMSGDSDNDGTLDGVGGVAKQNRVSSSEHGVREEMGGEEEGGGGGGRPPSCMSDASAEAATTGAWRSRSYS